MANTLVPLPDTQRRPLRATLPPAPTVAPPADLNVVAALFWRRRRLFISILAGFLTLVVIGTLLTPKTYMTTTKLITGGGGGGGGGGPAADAGTSLPVLNALVGGAGVRTPETYVELIQEIPVAERVIQNLGLKSTAKGLLGSVTAKPVTDTSIIELSVNWADPNESARIANEFATVFVDRERELIGDQATSALKFLSSKIPEARDDMLRAEKELASFQASHMDVFVNVQTQGVVSNLSAIQSSLAKVHVDKSQAEAALANVSGQMAGMAPQEQAATSLAVNPVVAALQAQLAQVDVQLGSAQKLYTESHPAVIALRQQRAQLQSQIAAQPATIVAGRTVATSPTYERLREQSATLQAQIASDGAQESALKVQGDQLMGQAKLLPNEGLQLADLQRKSKFSEEVYTTLEQRFSEATIAKTATLSDVAITQPAVAAFAVRKPRLVTNLAVGLFIGLVLAISGVFLIEYFDNTFKDAHDVARLLPLPVLASVPRVTDENFKALPWLRALTNDAFLELISALHYSSDKPLRSLAVTSPMRGDGKSTLALNLAIALAEVGPGVLIVDADMRQPTLHHRAGLPDHLNGLADVLVGSIDVKQAIVPTKHHGLSLLPAGRAVPSPLRLLQSETFDRVLDELQALYPMVIIDTPAIMGVFDAALIAAKTDGAVVVVAAGQTDSRLTSSALQRLTSVGSPNLLGIVLNQIDPKTNLDGYYRPSNMPFQLKDAITPS